MDRQILRERLTICLLLIWSHGSRIRGDKQNESTRYYSLKPCLSKTPRHVGSDGDAIPRQRQRTFHVVANGTQACSPQSFVFCPHPPAHVVARTLCVEGFSRKMSRGVAAEDQPVFAGCSAYVSI